MFRLLNHIPVLLWVFLPVMFMTNCASAQKTDTAFMKPVARLEYGPEFFSPIAGSNQIRTINFNAYVWKPYFKNIDVYINAGVTASFGWGSVKEISISSKGVFREHRTAALGFGPVLQVQFPLIRIKRFSIEGEASGAVLLYNTRFPYGGDIYNFMFRVGPSLAYSLNTLYTAKLGYRWMHVSNGQGMVPQNPMYEGQGMSFTLARYF